MWPGVKTWFGQIYEEYPREYDALYDEETSDKAYEEDVESSGFGYAVKKPQGGSFSYDDHSQGYIARYTHELWGLGYIVTYEEIQDNQYEAKSFKRAKMLAFSMNQTKEVNGADLFNNGFDTNYPIGDGAAFFSTAHPTIAGNQSNTLTNQADLSEASLEDALIQISLTKNNRGLIINNKPEMLAVSAYDAFNAARILNSPLNTTDAGNAINAVRYLSALPRGYVVNHYFTDSDAWFIRTNLPDGTKLYQREKYQFLQDNDGDTMNAKAKAFERYRFGVSDWRQWFGVSGS